MAVLLVIALSALTHPLLLLVARRYKREMIYLIFFGFWRARFQTMRLFKLLPKYLRGSEQIAARKPTQVLSIEGITNAFQEEAGNSTLCFIYFGLRSTCLYLCIKVHEGKEQ